MYFRSNNFGIGTKTTIFHLNRFEAFSKMVSKGILSLKYVCKLKNANE